MELHLPQDIADKIDRDSEVELIKERKDDPDDEGELFSYGEISAISPLVDPKTGTIFTEILVKEEEVPFKVGNFVQVNLVTERREGVVVVKNESIIYEKNKPYIYRVDDEPGIEGDSDGEPLTVEKISPELGMTDGIHTEIIDGIDPGDKVVIEGQGLLHEKAKVEIFNY